MIGLLRLTGDLIKVKGKLLIHLRLIGMINETVTYSKMVTTNECLNKSSGYCLNKMFFTDKTFKLNFISTLIF
jgi:hypothetical protein